MVSSPARTVEQYLADLPPERRYALEVVRTVILENLPSGYQEGMQFGMIGYYVPLERFPETYNGQALTIAGMASQKNHMSLYLMSVYGHPETRRWFQKAYKESGKKLDMGKSCIRFRTVNDLPLEVVGQAIGKVSVEDYIAHYERSQRGTRVRAKAAGKTRGTKTKTGAGTRTRTRPDQDQGHGADQDQGEPGRAEVTGEKPLPDCAPTVKAVRRLSISEEHPVALANRLASRFELSGPLEAHDFPDKGNINRHTFAIESFGGGERRLLPPAADQPAGVHPPALGDGGHAGLHRGAAAQHRRRSAAAGGDLGADHPGPHARAGPLPGGAGPARLRLLAADGADRPGPHLQEPGRDRRPGPAAAHRRAGRAAGWPSSARSARASTSPS